VGQSERSSLLKSAFMRSMIKSPYKMMSGRSRGREQVETKAGLGVIFADEEKVVELKCQKWRIRRTYEVQDNKAKPSSLTISLNIVK
jgi:hypothetical protein